MVAAATAEGMSPVLPRYPVLFSWLLSRLRRSSRMRVVGRHGRRRAMAGRGASRLRGGPKLLPLLLKLLLLLLLTMMLLGLLGLRGQRL